MNPKTLHVLAEVAQLLGSIGALEGVLGKVSPWAGIVCAVCAGIATALKPSVIGAIPAPTASIIPPKS